jgi:phosphatidylglycerophosphate synthase
MKFFRIVKNVFSAEYANKAAIGNNLLLLLMYKFSYPFAMALAALGLRPNWITSLSLIASLAATYVLIVDDGFMFYILFWGGAILLDFCDGTVARKTNTLRKTAFRYDHTSDLFKIFVVILAVGIKYNDQTVWVLSLLAVFFFMFYAVLNHDLNSARQRQSQAILVSEKISDYSLADKKINETRLIRVAEVIYATFMTVNGHTLLIFLLFPLGKTWALAVLAYLAIISLSRSAVCILALVKLCK